MDCWNRTFFPLRIQQNEGGLLEQNTLATPNSTQRRRTGFLPHQIQHNEGGLLEQNILTTSKSTPRRRTART